MAEPEKAIIDSLYLNLISDNELQEIMPKINKQRYKELILRFNGKGNIKLKRTINS